MTPRLPTWSGLLAAALVAVVAPGCAEPPQPTAVVALVDLSASVSTETVDFYADTLATSVLGSLGPNDQVSVLPIDAGSEPRSEVLFALDLSTQDFTRKDDGLARRDERQQARREAFVKEAAGRLGEAIRSAAADRTALRGDSDIIGGLHAAASRFPAEPGYRRVLVILSDMIQESPEIDIRSLARAGEAGVAPLVESLEAAGRVPDLSDVTVIVVGAGETGTPGSAGETGAPGGNGAAYYRTVRAFWTQVFGRAEASFDQERHYGYRTQDVIPAIIAAPVKR